MSENIYESLLAEPVEGDDPAGEDVTDEETFQTLRDEVHKTVSAFGTNAGDWTKIRDMSAELLKRSKNLLIASYLCVALAFLKETEGLTGAVLGLEAMLKRWRGELHPKRERGKIAALLWMAQKAAEFSKREEFGSLLSPEAAGEASSAFKALGVTIEKVLPDSDIDFYPVVRTLDKLATRPVFIEKKEAEPLVEISETKLEAPEEKEQETSKLLDSAEEPPAKTADFRSGKSVAIPDAPLEAEFDEESLRTFFNAFITSAQAMRSADPSDYRAYQLVRMAVWAQIRKAPNHDNYVTKLPPPTFNADLGELAASGLWNDLLEAAENCACNYAFTFRLDVHRYSALALRNLGEKYRDAERAVVSETLLFLERMPEIVYLIYSDEGKTPFASPETKAWLDSLSGASAKSGGTALEAKGRSSSEKIMARAREIALDPTKIPKAVRMLQKRIHREDSTRARILLRTGLNELLSGREEYALQILANSEVILESERRHRLSEWEREFAIEALASVRKACGSMSGEEFEKLASEAAMKVAKLDMAASLD